MPISDRAAGLVRTTWERLRPASQDVARSMSATLFAEHPSVMKLFDDADSDAARESFVLVILEVVRSLDHPEVLTTEVVESGRRHVVYGVQSVHYDALRAALLAALATHLGADFTTEVRLAWAAAYDGVADVMRNAGEQVRAARPR